MRSLADDQELLRAVDDLDLEEGAWVATDADGTLWDTDVAALAWRRLLAERRIRPQAGPMFRRLLEGAGGRPEAEVHEAALRVMDLYRAGRIDDMAMVTGMSACYAGWTTPALRRFAAEVAQEAAEEAYAATVPLLRGLLERGLRLVVVSGSPTVFVEEALRALGFDPLPPVRGVDLRCEGEEVTVELLEPVTWEAGKVTALESLGARPPAVALGDTLGDRELLEAATALRVLVHPRPNLRSYAEEQEGPWALFQPGRTRGGRRVRPSSVDRAVE